MKTLWLGLEAPISVFHYPMIAIKALPFEIPPLKYTHVIFTSKTTVDLFQDISKELIVLAVGKKTAQKTLNFKHVMVAENECAEGIVELLKKVDPNKSVILYPHSKKSRPLIKEYLVQYGYHFVSIDAYDVQFQAPHPTPNLEDFEKIVFTSPSCVDAFFNHFKCLPKHIMIECIGQITERHFNLTKMILNV